MSDLVMEVTEQNFEDAVIGGEQPVLVDFWAPWCGPCKAMGPVIDALAGQYGDRMTFTKCNVDDAPEIARRYGIKSIPTLILFRDGKPMDIITGAVSRQRVMDSIEGVLAGRAAGPAFPMA